MVRISLIVCIFILMGNLILGNMFEYDQNNHLIKSTIGDYETIYIYNELQQLEKKISKRSRHVVYFKYSDNKLKKIITKQAGNLEDAYDFFYDEKNLINYYKVDLRNGPETLVYLFFNKKKRLLNFNSSQDLKIYVTNYGNLELVKPSYKDFGYSNVKYTVEKNNKGEVIKKTWDHKDQGYNHVKYFEYDNRGNLINVKSKTKSLKKLKL